MFGRPLTITMCCRYIQIKTANVVILSHIGDNDAATKIIIEIYKKHPVVIKSTDIFENNIIKNYFQFQSVTKFYIVTLLKHTDIEKATGADKIPPKLVKLSANIVCTVYETINYSLWWHISRCCQNNQRIFQNICSCY